jgi:hypothetical protein
MLKWYPELYPMNLESLCRVNTVKGTDRRTALIDGFYQKIDFKMKFVLII